MDRPEILQPALTSAEAAAAILERFDLAQQLRDETLEAASDACRAALDCGDLLLKQKELHKGQFDLWLRCYCPKIGESIANGFMRIARLRRALGDEPVDSQLVWQFYHATGILPPRPAAQRNPAGQVLQFWSLTTKLQNWLPALPENQKPRLKTWWEELGRAQGWLS